MDVLDEVAADVGVQLVGAGQPFDRGAELGGRGGVSLILSAVQGQARLPCPSAR